MGSSCVKRPIVKINKKPTSELEKLTRSSNIREKYDPISLLGNGAFGKVRLFRSKTAKDLRFAIKTIKKEQMPKDLFNFLVDEVKIISKMDHPNIVKYYETFEDEHYIHIVMEYLQGEDLFKLIVAKKNEHFSEKDIAEILSCLMKSLSYIHGQGIVHRDIKPENILFSKSNNYNTLKLIDFGLSTNLKSDSRFRVGTPFYMSPEIILGDFSYKSDVWSVGVILFVMLTGKFPFNGKTNEDVFEEINKKELNFKYLDQCNCSDLVKDLVSKLLIKDQNKRISIEKALKHPWFKHYFHTEKNPQKIDNQIIESMKNFTRKSLFQKEALFYIAKLSKEDEIKKLKNAFFEMDKNNTGTLDFDEINVAFKNMGIEIDEAVWDGLDFHRDNEVNYTEFLAATISSVNFLREEQLWSAFKYFSEKNKSDYITGESVLSALRMQSIQIDEDGINEFFKNLKEDHKLNFEDFKKLVVL